MLIADPENLFWKGGGYKTLGQPLRGRTPPPPQSNYIVSLKNVNLRFF